MLFEILIMISNRVGCFVFTVDAFSCDVFKVFPGSGLSWFHAFSNNPDELLLFYNQKQTEYAASNIHPVQQQFELFNSKRTVQITINSS